MPQSGRASPNEDVSGRSTANPFLGDLVLLGDLVFLVLLGILPPLTLTDCLTMLLLVSNVAVVAEEIGHDQSQRLCLGDEGSRTARISDA